MVCRPDSQMTMWKPTACQIDMNMIASSAVLGCPASPARGCRTCASKPLISPSGWYMNSHSIETTTIEVTTGRK